MSKPIIDTFTPAETSNLISLYRDIEAEVLARAAAAVSAMERSERRLSRDRGLNLAAKLRYIERADALKGAEAAVRNAIYRPRGT